MNSENNTNQLKTPEKIAPASVERHSLPDVDMNLLNPNFSPEVLSGIENAPEKKEIQSEAQAIASDIATHSVSSTPPQPGPQASVPAQATSLPIAVPATAHNLDRIEQEWVDATKQVFAMTTEDPNLREEQLKDLQVDYLFKRYGRKPGDSNQQKAV